MEQKNGIGERIRMERERLGLSQPAFAAIGDSSKNSQLAWEKGAAYPNAAVLSAWAALGVDVAFILTGKAAANALSAEEETLVAYFRQASPDVRRAALGALIGAQLAGAPVGSVNVTSKGQRGGVQVGVNSGTITGTRKATK